VGERLGTNGHGGRARHLFKISQKHSRHTKAEDIIYLDGNKSGVFLVDKLDIAQKLLL